MSEKEYTEDCCFNYRRDNCKGKGCPCRCHFEVTVSPDCGHEAEIERYRQRSRDEDTARIKLNHERIRFRDALEQIRQEVGTSTRAWHLANRALTGERCAALKED